MILETEKVKNHCVATDSVSGEDQPPDLRSCVDKVFTWPNVKQALESFFFFTKTLIPLMKVQPHNLFNHLLYHHTGRG